MKRKRRLTFKEERRIDYAIKDRIMHFSPTISPAPKNIDRGEIESLFEAIEYYKKAGKNFVIMQPKYMGSYCDIYLNRDIEKTKFFSRKGYPVPSRVKREDLIEAAKPIYNKLDRYWDKGAELIIVQAELMPWSALGKGLIERDFKGYNICHQDHCTYLKETGLKSKIESLKKDDKFQEFLKDREKLSRKNLKKKYPDHIVRQYESLIEIQVPPNDEYQKAIDIYQEQVRIYGGDSPLHFKPFNWLKIVLSGNKDKEILNTSNVLGFSEVSDDEYYVIAFDGEDYQKQIEKAYDIYGRWITDEKMEGVIIKPDEVWNTDTAPMLKVRNLHYLQMIYGVNFLSDYEYYLRRRGVGKKIRCSINEWNLAQTLLRIPMKDISPENQRYVDLVTARILEEDFEAKLDSRL